MLKIYKKETRRKSFKQYFIFLPLFFSFILFLSFTSAAAVQINQNVDQGITIDYPKYESIRQLESFNLSVHTINNSDGKIINSPNCTLQIQKSNGQIALDDVPLNKIGNHHNYFITLENFSEMGQYAFFINCEDINIGGFASGIFTITANGEPYQNFPIQFQIIILGISLLVLGYSKRNLSLFRFFGAIIILMMGVLTFYPGYNFINYSSYLGKLLGFILVSGGTYFIIGAPLEDWKYRKRTTREEDEKNE